MAGSSALYCSDNFIVVTRLRAAVMASGEGVCAGEAQIENRSTLAMINRHLDMGSSDDRSRDDTRKLSFPTQQQEASTSREIDAAFATFVRERPDALFVGGDTVFASRRVQLAHLATRHAIPAILHSVSIPKQAGPRGVVKSLPLIGAGP